MKEPEIPYQLRDFKIIDYQLYALKDELREKVHILRGPQPTTLKKNNYFCCLGPASTFGCYTEKPYTRLLEEYLLIPGLNLGIPAAGSTFYLEDENRLLIEQANNSKFVVILVMSGRSHPSSMFMDFQVNQTSGPKKMNKYKQLFQTNNSSFIEVINSMRESFVNDYISLSRAIKVPKILLYLSIRSPQYEDDFSATFARAHQGFPHFINSSTIERILPYFDDYVECISKRGLPQKLINRFTGLLVDLQLTAKDILSIITTHHLRCTKMQLRCCSLYVYSMLNKMRWGQTKIL